MPDAQTGWASLSPASYQADGEVELKFMVGGQLTTDGALRLNRRKVPWRPGELLDETGPDANEFSVEAYFFSTLDEPGISSDGLWPDRLNALWDQFESGKTGTLHLPWRRNIRCKAATYQRRASADGEREGEILRVHFIADTEDRLDREAATNVGVRANLTRVVEIAGFDAESEGGWTGAWEDLTQFAADLEGVLNAPSEFLADVSHKSERVRRAARSIIGQSTSLADGSTLLNDPDGEPVYRRLLLIEELAARAEADAAASLPATITVRFEVDRDIHSIAAELGQSPRDLIALNSAIEDLNWIPAGTPVVVLAG